MLFPLELRRDGDATMSARAASIGLILWLATRAASGAGLTVTDDAGLQVTLPGPAQRIVSLAPGTTEMLFAAGAGSHVIATTEYADEPPAARRVPRIGDSNAVDLERLVVLRPDVVVVWPGGNNEAQVARIVSLHMPVYRQKASSLVQLAASLRRLGALAGTEREADVAARAVEARLAQLQTRYAGLRPVSVLLQVWNHPVYTIGGAQILTDVLRVCGARNVFADLPDLGPAVTVEAVIARDPQLIIAAGADASAASWLADWRKFEQLSAVRSANLITFADPRLSRPGPSVLGATEALCRTIDAARQRILPAEDRISP